LLGQANGCSIVTHAAFWAPQGAFGDAIYLCRKNTIEKLPCRLIGVM
jgi:hypothetical protein